MKIRILNQQIETRPCRIAVAQRWELAALAAVLSSPGAIIPPGGSVERGTLKKPETQHGASGIGVWVGTKSIQPLLGSVFGQAGFSFGDVAVQPIQDFGEFGQAVAGGTVHRVKGFGFVAFEHLNPGLHVLHALSRGLYQRWKVTVFADLLSDHLLLSWPQWVFLAELFEVLFSRVVRRHDGL
jgi:hypothetical protein